MCEYVNLEVLRDYLHQEIGDIVTVIYDRARGPYANKDRIRIERDTQQVCSIYDVKNSDFFDIIFYNPFTCKSAGYSSNICLTLSEVPNAIKNRIHIHDGINNNRIDINIPTPRNLKDTVAFYSGRGNGKLWATFNSYVTNRFTIKDVIFHDPATIVLWNDGTKTVVKCQKGEEFDPEKGLAMAISKKVLGNDYGYYETFAKYIGRYNKKHKEAKE